jgi:hypothetical protein
MRGYNNKMIVSIWRCIESVLHSMVYDESIEESVMYGLLAGRDAGGYELLATSTNDDTLDRRATGKEILKARDALIDNGRVSVDDKDREFTITKSEGCAVYGCLSSALLHIKNIIPLLKELPIITECNHVMYPCMLPHDIDAHHEIGLECGTSTPCSVFVKLQGRWVAFE